MPSEVHDARLRLNHRDAFWPAQLAVLGAILLYLVLPEKLSVGPTWVTPAVEGVLLVGLVLVTPRGGTHPKPMHRRLSLALTGLVSAVNIVSLGLLVHYLIAGGHAPGRPLIGAGVVLWVTNVLLFAVWFWELDRGGPVERRRGPDRSADFLFPQATGDDIGPRDWRPGFVDYLYVSLTNATAFSPTDTMPLTPGAKALMGLQSIAALAITGLVVARAVNVLS